MRRRRAGRSGLVLLSATAMLAAVAVVEGCKQTHVVARVGTGRYNLAVDQTGRKDEQYATFAAARIESVGDPKGEGSRVGVGLEAATVVGDNFAVGGAGGRTELSDLEITPYVAVHPNVGDMFGLPLRFGLVYHKTELESGPADLEWEGLGLRAAMFPELALLRATEHVEELAVFAGAEGSIGIATAKTDTGDSGGMDARRIGVTLEAGAHYRYGWFKVRVSLLRRYVEYEKTELESGGELQGMSGEFTGVMVGVEFYF